MTPNSRPELLHSIDDRQQEVLQRLDELEARVQQLLTEWAQGERTTAAEIEVMKAA